ncbi:hypothetical protein [Solicola gregarius]|uniref:Uncharacterized protein n=1 Tax=Solicola gregarius TaxID=2908642 RepID=A0AA46TLS3_9ACTN|nr:hypothetical protein [Solicola gregarius]UYM07600.1 hypothetical protein L0C25_11160 [Solicola gregarius]
MTQLATREDNGLLVRIARDCDVVIAAEVERLRRRRPCLTQADLDAVDAALAELAERLLLDAIRRRPALHEAISPIFSTPSPLNSQGKATS